MIVTLRGTSLVFFLMNVLKGQLMQRIATQRKKPILKEDNFQVLFYPRKIWRPCTSQSKKILFYSCQFGRKDLKQSGVSSLLLVVMKIDCSGPMSGISQVTQVLQITCHTINYPKYKISLKLQIKNSIHLICSSRWQFCCTNLLRNESNASWNTIVQEFPLRIIQNSNLSPNFALFCYSIFFVINESFFWEKMLVRRLIMKVSGAWLCFSGKPC